MLGGTGGGGGGSGGGSGAEFGGHGAGEGGSGGSTSEQRAQAPQKMWPIPPPQMVLMQDMVGVGLG